MTTCEGDYNALRDSVKISDVYVAVVRAFWTAQLHTTQGARKLMEVTLV
jgi:hypothetical protein